MSMHFIQYSGTDHNDDDSSDASPAPSWREGPWKIISPDTKEVGFLPLRFSLVLSSNLIRRIRPMCAKRYASEALALA